MPKPLSLKEAALLADDIQHKHRNGTQCHMSKLADQMSAEDFDVLKSLIKSDYQHSTVARVLKTAGYEITALMVARHRGTTGSTCKCGLFND